MEGKKVNMVEEKISGGKLIYIYFLDMQNTKKIGKIKICGDFFLHPEEKIENIEKIVAQLNVEVEEGQLEDTIGKELENCEVAGFSAKDLAKLIKRGRRG